MIHHALLAKFCKLLAACRLPLAGDFEEPVAASTMIAVVEKGMHMHLGATTTSTLPEA
jgi:hypothetical protein